MLPPESSGSSVPVDIPEKASREEEEEVEKGDSEDVPGKGLQLLR